VAIIGAGFGGIATAVALRSAGIDNLVIIDGADGVGGTWRRHTYPGASCDVPSHMYSLSFAPNRSWSRFYAHQPEILAYLETVVDDFDLRRHLKLDTLVRQAHWDSNDDQWALQLQSADGGNVDSLRADIVVSAVGLLGDSRLPDIDGLSDFRGSLIHTSAWDPEMELAGRRVAVIGTAASGVQVVPEIARIAQHVSVFQRAPSWMVPKHDRPFSAAELSRFRRPWGTRLERWQIFKQFHRYAAKGLNDPLVIKESQVATSFLESSILDRNLRRALTPDYQFGCERVLRGDGYYEALQRENVQLVTDNIARITANAVVTSKEEVFDVDAIVCATGFQKDHHLNGIQVIGRDGRSIQEHWGAEPSTYLGVAVNGFPNFFMLYGPNTNQAGASMIYILEADARLVASAASRVARWGGHLDVRPEAEKRYNDLLSADGERSVWKQCGVTRFTGGNQALSQMPYSEVEYARRTWRLRPRDWDHRNRHIADDQTRRRSDRAADQTMAMAFRTNCEGEPVNARGRT
jgi:cation diffusion facilitator CzcD-associated flavoprotein CzcO